MTEELKDYRDHLVQAEHKSIEAYDKGLLTLSGGAIALSFVFLRDLRGDEPVSYAIVLLLAWLCWIGSIGSTIFSFYASHRGLRAAIHQVDTDEIDDNCLGGLWNRLVHCANVTSGLLFLLGLLLVVFFAFANLETGHA